LEHGALRRLHAAPAEQVHHLARDAHVEQVVGLAQQMQGTAPLA
jgi:hypothetical protein